MSATAKTSNAFFMIYSPGGVSLSLTGQLYHGKLLLKQDVPVRCRGEFFALASRVMRGILVDHVRKQRAAKRGGSEIEISLEEVSTGEEPRVLDFLVLDDALTRLTGIKERYTQVVEMRFFGGLNIQEIAGVLGVSRATVEREWNFARLWLVRELGSISPSFRDTGTGMG